MVETASSEQKSTLVERIVEILSAIFHPLILPAIAFTFLVIALQLTTYLTSCTCYKL